MSLIVAVAAGVYVAALFAPVLILTYDLRLPWWPAAGVGAVAVLVLANVTRRAGAAPLLACLGLLVIMCAAYRVGLWLDRVSSTSEAES